LNNFRDKNIERKNDNQRFLKLLALVIQHVKTCL